MPDEDSSRWIFKFKDDMIRICFLDVRNHPYNTDLTRIFFDRIEGVGIYSVGKDS